MLSLLPVLRHGQGRCTDLLRGAHPSFGEGGGGGAGAGPPSGAASATQEPGGLPGIFAARRRGTQLHPGRTPPLPMPCLLAARPAVPCLPGPVQCLLHQAALHLWLCPCCVPSPGGRAPRGRLDECTTQKLPAGSTLKAQPGSSQFISLWWGARWAELACPTAWRWQRWRSWWGFLSSNTSGS